VRSGYSFLELVAVVAVIGVLAAIAAVRFSADSVGNLAAKVDARKVALDLAQARRRAIATGDNHLLVFQQSGGDIVGYTVHRRWPDTSTTAVDEYRPFPGHLTVTVAPSDPEFTFQGEALAAYTITLAGPERTWQVTVAQATGAARATEQ